MSDELTKLVMQAAALADKIERAFGGLTVEQINWKPNETSWSVGQCLEHLIITNKLEFPAIENALAAGYKNPFWSKLPFLPAVSGKLMIYLFSPENPRRVKAPKSFRPSASRIDANIVKDFVAHQQKVIGLLEKSRALHLRKIKVVSPVTDFITYSLYDSFKVLVVHEERHFRQAERVTKENGFPG
jgi:hypothetical protein